ncbi:isochorismatase family protein [Actinoplanes sp. CA-030573]|uniref:isochorismatase family protein n=1 Tax=Actinoplanes sp. CA-030573 TaxID=3239898 RepID=UPI003D8C3F2B
MTTLQNRPKSALLIIDVQRDVVARAHQRDAVVGNIAELVDRARAAGVDVVWVQHSDPQGMPLHSEGWQIVPELPPGAGDPVVHKLYGDSFEATDLESVLAERQVGHLYVTGAQSDACVRSTIHGAFTRGYDTTLVADAHTTEDLSAYGAPGPDQVIAHTNLYWQYQSAPGRAAAVVPTAEVNFKA